MALQKQVRLATGVDVNYWIVGRFSLDREQKRMVVDVVPYLSKEAKDAGSKPFERDSITVKIEDLIYPDDSPYKNITHFTDYFSVERVAQGSIYELIYNYLKLLRKLDKVIKRKS